MIYFCDLASMNFKFHNRLKIWNKKDSQSQTQLRKKESYMKYWRNETPVKSNINREKYAVNNNFCDKAEIFFEKI